MKTYETDEEKKALAARNQHIPDHELQKDINDTKAEMGVWRKEADALEQMPMDAAHRFDHMRASARRTRIIEAERFIAALEIIQEVRAAGLYPHDPVVTQPTV